MGSVFLVRGGSAADLTGSSNEPMWSLSRLAFAAVLAGVLLAAGGILTGSFWGSCVTLRLVAYFVLAVGAVIAALRAFFIRCAN